MFKVSFKETKDNLSKIIEKKGKTTTVTLKGVVKLPAFWESLPKCIYKWLLVVSKIELYENLYDNTLTIFAEGTAMCHEDDKYDSLLGERLAEARAKCKIYKFFFTLCDNLYEYYSTILFGSGGVVDSGEGDCVAKDLKKYEDLYNREIKHIEDLLASKENG